MSTTSIDANGYPIAFKTSNGHRVWGLATGAPGTEIAFAEVRHAGHHQKEAVVQEGRDGPSWRLASDEGVHLKGTDLAPFPLGYFNAGLQANFAGTIARLARARGIAIDRLQMELRTSYSLTGSFVQGTGIGVAEGVAINLDIQSKAALPALSNLVRDAVAASPALAMISMPLENTFALYVNGRRKNPTTLPASSAANVVDPFIKHASLPRQVPGSSDPSGLVVKSGEQQPQGNRLKMVTLSH